MFELTNRNENIDVFKKSLIRAATDFMESIVFRSQRIEFSVDKMGHFQVLEFYHEPMDNSNFRSFSMRLQKLKNNPTYPSASGCADPKNAPDLPRRPVDAFRQNMKFFYQVFHKKALSELQNTVVQFIITDLG